MNLLYRVFGWLQFTMGWIKKNPHNVTHISAYLLTHNMYVSDYARRLLIMGAYSKPVQSETTYICATLKWALKTVLRTLFVIIF